jgi:hypothetical protein
MLQAARRAPVLLGDDTSQVEAFIRGQLNPGGGFAGRDGESDLHYTTYGLETLLALGRELPVREVAHYLMSFGDGAGLDFMHAAALARCWANLTSGFECVPVAALLRHIERHRAADGGYGMELGAAHGTIYSAFFALRAYQDLGQPLPRPERLLAGLDTLRAFDGGIVNGFETSEGVTPATAAFVILSAHLGRPAEPSFGEWLLARDLPKGGFGLNTEARIADLLSTSLALHALNRLNVPIDGLRQRALSFVRSLWNERGGFHGHWADEDLDLEYLYYGLIALGNLAA